MDIFSFGLFWIFQLCMVLFSCDLDMMLETVIMSLGLVPPLIRLVAPGAHGAQMQVLLILALISDFLVITDLIKLHCR